MKRIMFNDRYGLTQAVIEGRKTMMRREPLYTDSDYYSVSCWPDQSLKKECVRFDFDNGLSHTSRYAIGEVVAVAQSYKDCGEFDIYEGPKDTAGWNNKMFVRAELMPHQIRITDVRCERLQDIGDEDCMREGIWRADNLGLQGTTY